MPEPHILVRNLSKTYRVAERQTGLRASIGNLWRREYRDVEAVRDIGFSIEEEEVVGFIGPNGAGKTTTLKMLAGLLYPTQGEVRVAGFVPWERRPEYLKRISMVMGNKSQVSWDIPPMDTFSVLAEIYRVPKVELRRTLAELVDLLDMQALLSKPVRNLSLGERMKCELVAGLLYRPRVLFLDEPTLGLDISMQQRLRGFVAEYNRRSGATVILTSHYMADVVALCQRVIVIHHGQLLYDGALTELAKRLAPFKLIRLVLPDEQASLVPTLPEGVDVLEQEQTGWTLRVNRDQVPEITTRLLNELPVIDLTIEEPPLEAVIDQIYQEGRV